MREAEKIGDLIKSRLIFIENRVNDSLILEALDRAAKHVDELVKLATPISGRQLVKGPVKVCSACGGKKFVAGVPCEAC